MFKTNRERGREMWTESERGRKNPEEITATQVSAGNCSRCIHNSVQYVVITQEIQAIKKINKLKKNPITF